jgi:hypothetical protein
MNKKNAKELLNEIEKAKFNAKEIGKISLDAIGKIHLAQGKNDLWEKAVEVNKIAEKLHNSLSSLESKICFQVIDNKKE